MIETPRTDSSYVGKWLVGDTNVEMVRADFARQLERELIEAMSQRGSLAYSSHEGGWTPLGETVVRLEKKGIQVEAALRELLRLYDWRNELGRIERDFNHDKKQMKTWLNQYGREKKAAWAVARELLCGGETAIRGSQSSQPRLEGETPSPATSSAPDR